MTQTALLLLALAPAAAVQPAAAEPAAGQATLPQAATPPSQQDAATVVLPDVEVTAARRGVALGGQEPIVSYDTAQIQAFGATNIGELVTLLRPRPAARAAALRSFW